ncbi:hypothetical protein QX223_21455 [Vibrio vulnificus]|uniref:hypothetical protein n=1 Tax=Vibrio vulnificus TaxID=672 RepID=UPI002879D5F4|nr:hypothetical protein [Vibrio vulnificus]MDS1828853.1 hypothetical protein [Vibrio vulnificus]
MKKLAEKLRCYLEENRKELDLHRVRLFPRGSCETTSLLLGKIIQDEYPNEDVYFIEGTNSSYYEKHFWIEVGSLTFDLTADQFDEVDAPSYGNPIKEIQTRFDKVEKQSIGEALRCNDYATGKIEEFARISTVIRET